MPCLHSFNIAVVITFPIVVYYNFTEMHLCLILVLVDVIVTATIGIRHLPDVSICNLMYSTSIHFGAKLHYLNYICLLLFLNYFYFVLLQVSPDIHQNI